MPTLLKKISLVIILIFSLFAFRFLSPSPVRASPQEFVKAVQEGNNLQWYLGGKSGMLATTANSLIVAIGGARDEQGNLLQAGAIQTTTNLMASLYNRPVSSVAYVAYVLNHSGIAKSAYAQGAGWDFLTNTTLYKDDPAAGTTSQAIPVILQLWTISRNLVYLLFVVIFVAIGFMIMFRSKLNPQTVVNIQLALPNIVVSLVLVTFSYAICGFIIDTVFLGHKIIDVAFFQPTDSTLADKLIPSGSTYSDMISKIDFVTALLLPGNSATGVVSPWAGVNVFDQFLKFINLGNMFKLVENVLSGENFFTDLIPLIMVFTLLGIALKIFFALITKYVTLILSTIFSPFVFLLSAFPGKSEGTGNFLKTMLSAALSFPAISFMFYLSAFFVSNDVFLQLNGLPPLNKTGVLDPGLTVAGGALSGRVLEPLIALGILMATVQVPQAIDQALGVKAGITGAATPEIGGALRKIPIIGSLLG